VTHLPPDRAAHRACQVALAAGQYVYSITGVAYTGRRAAGRGE
jgi:hypothetical protein